MASRLWQVVTVQVVTVATSYGLSSYGLSSYGASSDLCKWQVDCASRLWQAVTGSYGAGSDGGK